MPNVFVRAGNFDISSCGPDELVTAINSANNAPDADSITLNGGCTYTLTDYDNSDAFSANGFPVVSSTITIHGNGATIIRNEEDGTPNFRFFEVIVGGQLDIRDLTFINGIAYHGGLFLMTAFLPLPMACLSAIHTQLGRVAHSIIGEMQQSITASLCTTIPLNLVLVVLLLY